MRHTILSLNLILLTFLTGMAQNDTILKDGHVNIATLILDFQTYEFEGGHLAYFECPGCTADSMQYFVNFQSPGDFGGISFSLNPEEHIFFDATIVWAGMGQIYLPENFNQSYPFTYEDHAVERPADIKYLGMDGQKLPEDSWVYEQTDSVWQVVDSLSITNLFAGEHYKAVVYFYPPSVGVLDPSVAKWVVFLYLTDVTNQVKYMEPSSVSVYPNPASSQVIVRFPNNDHPGSQFKISNIYGQVLLHGNINSETEQVDLSALSKGVYTILFTDQRGDILARKRIILE